MKKGTFFVLTVLAFSLAAAPIFSTGAEESESPAAQTDEIIVYAYDSFVSEWGPGPVTAEMFTEKYGTKVRLVSAGDSGQVLQRAVLEKNNPKADVIIGIDNNLLDKAVKEDILLPYRSENLDGVPESLQFDKTNSITPYDYGYFSFIIDTQAIEKDQWPTSLQDLTDARFSNSVIIMDPRTSSPGLGLLHWSVAVFGDAYLEFWNALKPSLLTVTDGWDTGYGLFTAGEAPLVLSYTTSPAYHVEYEETERYEAAVFDEGHYLQIEGAGILKGAQNLSGAKLFIDFLLSKEVQELIPLTNWMYPVADGVTLPESYDFAPKPSVTLSLPAEDVADNLEKRLDAWTELMSR